MAKNKGIGDFEDKINIYIDCESYNKLLSDGRSFGITDKKDKVNNNQMVNLIISNHLADYTNSLNKSINETVSILKTNSIRTDNISRLAREIVWKNSTYSYEFNGSSKEKTLPIRINKRNRDIIEENYYGLQDSVSKSNYLRGLLYSYLSLSPFEREKTLYRSEINKIQSAINEGQMIRYENKENGKQVELSPYKICPSIQENRNYLVGRTRSHITTIRLSNLSHIIVLKESCNYGDNFETYFSLMERNGVQFTIEKEMITKIKMSPDALKVFRRKEFDRPDPKEIQMLSDGSAIYTFDCSEFQINAYFNPFKGKIEIL